MFSAAPAFRPYSAEVALLRTLSPCTAARGRVKTGKDSLVIGDLYGAGAPKTKDITGNEPTLKSYLFERVRPIVEKALKANDKKSRPLISVYLNFKNEPPEMLQSLWERLGEYENWLTTAVKTKDAARQSLLDLKPMMLFVEDTTDDNTKEDYFYNRLPIGATLRVFGSGKLTPPPGNLNKVQAFEAQAKMKLEDLVKERASNYRRWWGNAHWDLMVGGGAPMKSAGQWTPEKEARLKTLVNYAHKMGYFASVWCFDGFEPSEDQGWGQANNFGSLEAVAIRWKAAAKAGVDFIVSDQYEGASKVIKSAGVNYQLN